MVMVTITVKFTVTVTARGWCLGARDGHRVIGLDAFLLGVALRRKTLFRGVVHQFGGAYTYIYLYTFDIP